MFPPVKGTQGSLHLSRLTRGYLSWCGASLRGKSPGRVALGRSLPSAPWLASQKSCKVPTGSWEGEGARAGTDPETEVQATEAWRGSDSGGCPHALSSSAFLVLEAEKLVGKPLSNPTAKNPVCKAEGAMILPEMAKEGKEHSCHQKTGYINFGVSI